jgi:hypothetical protein
MLYEHGYIGIKDVQLVQEWILSLLAAGYQFPVPSEEAKKNAHSRFATRVVGKK